VMAMADLARASCDRPVALADIARRQEISLSYLEQLFSKLRKSGIVISARGPGGGYQLAYPMEQTRIADIILSVEEPIRATRCEAGSIKGCTGQSGRCITHDLWEELGRQIHIYLSSVTLADIVNGRVLGTSHAPVAASRQGSQAEMQPVGG